MLARLFGSPSSALSTTSSGDVDPWLLVPLWGGASVLLSCVGGHWPLGGSYLLAEAADWPLACATVRTSSPGGWPFLKPLSSLFFERGVTPFLLPRLLELPCLFLSLALLPCKCFLFQDFPSIEVGLRGVHGLQRLESVVEHGPHASSRRTFCRCLPLSATYRPLLFSARPWLLLL